VTSSSITRRSLAIASRKIIAAVAVLVALAVGYAAWAQLAARRGPQYWSFDPSAFTQGLSVHEGQLYEGTGLYGASSIRKVDLETGRVERQRPLDARYFGEGIAILGGELFQLTWQNGVGVVYDVDTFEVKRTFRYEGEGWGLTHDGRHLIMSDGSATIRYLDPQSFEVVRRLEVRDRERPVDRLNELEYIDGEIWANIWYDDRIVRIDPSDGAVLGYVDLARLYPRRQRADDVLNGIAYDADAKRLFVTGKNWPQLYEIRLVK
jgi:glutamine cyclotransferase